MMEKSNGTLIRMALLISTTAATGLVIGWGCSYLYFTQTSRQQKKLKSLNNAKEDHPDAIKQELTSRVRTFFGEDGFMRLENAYVIVSLLIAFLLSTFHI